MKKSLRIISSFLLLILLIFVTGCQSDNFEFKESQQESDIIFVFETKLNENNIAFDRTALAVNEQNAKECYYYYIEENNPLIIYVFDEDSEEYKKIVENKYITKDGIGNPIYVETNKGIVIEKNENMLHYGEIIKILNEL